MVTQAVYPRVCGGTGGSFDPIDLLEGLSPRVRGNHAVIMEYHRAGRSIPACAGEPRSSVRAAVFRKVYPRVCGGTTLGTDNTLDTWGLSPRVRGNPIRSDPGNGPWGSIPACAGEPLECQWRQGARRVYPRVCGGTSAGPIPSIGRQKVAVDVDPI